MEWLRPTAVTPASRSQLKNNFSNYCEAFNTNYKWFYIIAAVLLNYLHFSNVFHQLELHVKRLHFYVYVAGPNTTSPGYSLTVANNSFRATFFDH